MFDNDLPAGFRIPRLGSRKHEVWLEFRRAGRDAALAKAENLNIKESSAKAWLSDWQMAVKGKLPAWMRKEVKIRSDQILHNRTAALEKSKLDRKSSGVRFALEYQLRDFLASNLHAIEVGQRQLSLYIDASKRNGIEYPTSTGQIDILAIDQTGDLFVFELKRAKSPDSAIGQVMRYMAWVKDNVASGKEVYGIVVAEKITDKLKLAASIAPNIMLFEYQASLMLKETKWGRHKNYDVRRTITDPAE